MTNRDSKPPINDDNHGDGTTGFEFTDEDMSAELTVTSSDGRLRYVYDRQADDLDVLGVRFLDAQHGPVVVLFTARQAVDLIANIGAQLRNLDTLRLEHAWRADDDDDDAAQDDDGGAA